MDNIIISGDITDETVKEYLRAKTIETLANAYKQTVCTDVAGWRDVNIALQKAISDEIAKNKNRTLA
jgi:hypothetical protein